MRTGARSLPASLPVPLHYAVALGLVGAITAVGVSAGPALDEAALFLLLAMAVMAAAWFGGTGPGLAAVVSGALLGAVVADAGARAIDVRLALFIVHGLVLTALIATLSRSRQLAETRLREAETARIACEAAQRLKDEFLATVSHELRTPLNAMLGWLHLLRTAVLDPHTRARGLESVERNARRQARLTGDLLDLSRTLTGTLRLESEEVSLTDAVRQAVLAVDTAARARHVDVVTAWHDDVYVFGDALRLRQVAWHLLANAVKFTPGGGRVDVDVRGEDDQGVLRVVDTGSGIETGLRDRLFDPFTVRNGASTRAGGGLGVGLSLVRELVELQGGEIATANLVEASGAAFTVRFPLRHVMPSRDTARTEKARRDARPLGLRGLRVLIFGREHDVRDVLTMVLRNRGGHVRAVASVGEALEVLEVWRPDLLVSDGAPDEDAFVLSAKVRRLDADRGGRIPAIALTRLARTEQRGRALLAGATRRVPKPLDAAFLADEIERLARVSLRAVS